METYGYILQQILNMEICSDSKVSWKHAPKDTAGNIDKLETKFSATLSNDMPSSVWTVISLPNRN